MARWPKRLPVKAGLAVVAMLAALTFVGGIVGSLHGERGTTSTGPVGVGALDDAAELYDVCIVGSGFSGTVLGTELAKAGLRTLILESGRGVGAPLGDRLGHWCVTYRDGEGRRRVLTNTGTKHFVDAIKCGKGTAN